MACTTLSLVSGGALSLSSWRKRATLAEQKNLLAEFHSPTSIAVSKGGEWISAPFASPSQDEVGVRHSRLSYVLPCSERNTRRSLRPSRLFRSVANLCSSESILCSVGRIEAVNVVGLHASDCINTRGSPSRFDTAKAKQSCTRRAPGGFLVSPNEDGSEPVVQITHSSCIYVPRGKMDLNWSRRAARGMCCPRGNAAIALAPAESDDLAAVACAGFGQLARSRGRCEAALRGINRPVRRSMVDGVSPSLSRTPPVADGNRAYAASERGGDEGKRKGGDGGGRGGRHGRAWRRQMKGEGTGEEQIGRRYWPPSGDDKPFVDLSWEAMRGTLVLSGPRETGFTSVWCDQEAVEGRKPTGRNGKRSTRCVGCWAVKSSRIGRRQTQLSRWRLGSGYDPRPLQAIVGRTWRPILGVQERAEEKIRRGGVQRGKSGLKGGESDGSVDEMEKRKDDEDGVMLVRYHSHQQQLERQEEQVEEEQEVDDDGGGGTVVGDTILGVTTFAGRFWMITSTSVAFAICNMDKVNMSIAVIPMSHQFLWSATTSGLVQSSFFWGYILSQLPGGWLATRFRGGRVLSAGVFIWSVATAAVPVAAFVFPTLLFSRFLVGLGEGVAPSAAVNIIARTIPVSERSRAVTFVFGGLNVGTIAGYLLAPPCIDRFGWESVFYLFGFFGIVWCLAFREPPSSSCVEGDGGVLRSVGKGTASRPNDVSVRSLMNDDRVKEREAQERRHRQAEALAMVVHDSAKLKDGELEGGGRTLISSGGKSHGDGKSNLESEVASHGESEEDSAAEAIPWGAFLRSSAVWAMIYAHFCGNWAHYTLLAWLPTYFSDELHLDLTHAALVSILPPLASIVVASMAGPLADKLITQGMDVTSVRKLCQSIGFLSPAACMALTALNPDLDKTLVILLLTGGLSLSSFTLAGLYCSHQDISPRYSSILLGLTNTAGSIPGIVGVALTGYLFDHTHSWPLSLFAPSIFCQVTGTLVWNLFANSEPQDFHRLSEEKR